jgi:hypothetical protein
VRDVLVWLAIIGMGLAVGVAIAGFDPHPKAEGVDIAAGVLLIATVTVFVLALLRFFFKNLRGTA